MKIEDPIEENYSAKESHTLLSANGAHWITHKMDPDQETIPERRAKLRKLQESGK